MYGIENRDVRKQLYGCDSADPVRTLIFALCLSIYIGGTANLAVYVECVSSSFSHLLSAVQVQGKYAILSQGVHADSGGPCFWNLYRTAAAETPLTSNRVTPTVSMVPAEQHTA